MTAAAVKGAVAAEIFGPAATLREGDEDTCFVVDGLRSAEPIGFCKFSAPALWLSCLIDRQRFRNHRLENIRLMGLRRRMTTN
jgi:hypothetical protein